MKKITCALIALILISALFSCSGGGKGEETLPPVKVIGVNENEKVTSTLVRDGFSMNIYVTYSEITGYSGSEKSITLSLGLHHHLLVSLVQRLHLFVNLSGLFQLVGNFLVAGCNTVSDNRPREFCQDEEEDGESNKHPEYESE